MHLELTDEQTEALIRELSLIIEYDRYRLSPHIRTLKEILGMLRPDPAREPLAPGRHWTHPFATGARRRVDSNSKDRQAHHEGDSGPFLVVHAVAVTVERARQPVSEILT
jgi:hypothetical protein